jgi:hypothetical protein
LFCVSVPLLEPFGATEHVVLADCDVIRHHFRTCRRPGLPFCDNDQGLCVYTVAEEEWLNRSKVYDYLAPTRIGYALRIFKQPPANVACRSRSIDTLLH